MYKVLNFLILLISLFILEVLIDFILLVFIDHSLFDIDLFIVKRAWRGSGLWNYWRLLFYGFPYLGLKIILFDSHTNFGYFQHFCSAGREVFPALWQCSSSTI